MTATSTDLMAAKPDDTEWQALMARTSEIRERIAGVESGIAYCMVRHVEAPDQPHYLEVAMDDARTLVGLRAELAEVQTALDGNAYRAWLREWSAAREAERVAVAS